MLRLLFWTLGASGTDHYTFTGPGDLSGDTDPDLQLIRGQKYIFKNRSEDTHSEFKAHQMVHQEHNIMMVLQQ